MKVNLPKFRLRTAGICFVLFIIFLIFTFPFQNLKGYVLGEIYKQTKILVIADSMYLSLFGWPGVGFKQVDATIPIGKSEMDISCRKMVARVGLGSLIPPVPSVSLYMIDLKGGGDLYVKATISSKRNSIVIDANRVELSQFNYSGLPEPFQGFLNAKGRATIDNQTLSNSTGHIRISSEKLVTPPLGIPGFNVPSLDIGSLGAEIQIVNGTAEIKKFQMGSDVSGFKGAAAGSLKLGNQLGDSFLDLKINLELSDKSRQDPNAASLVSLLNLFENSPGKYGLKWNSTIDGMKTNFTNAIPRKAP